MEYVCINPLEEIEWEGLDYIPNEPVSSDADSDIWFPLDTKQ